MEHTPSNIDAVPEISGSADNKENKKKAKKSPKAERLVGAFAVKPEAADTRKEGDKPESWWGKTPRPEVGTAELSDADREQGPEDQETDEKLTTLDADEKRFIERELVRAEGLGEAETGQESVADEADPEQIVLEFRQRVFEGEDSDAVFADMISELQGEDEAGAQPAEEVRQAAAVESEPEYREFGDEGEIPLSEPEPDTLEPAGEADSRQEDSTPTTEDEAQPPVPPRPPVPPSGRGTPPAGPGDPRRFNQGPLPPDGSYDTALAATAQPEYYYQDNTLGVALLSGLVGYLIGRRRGRIKTERRLLPVQKKLRNEVKQLQVQLQTKEIKIREAAKQKARLEDSIGRTRRQRTRTESRPPAAAASNAERPSKVQTVIEAAIPKPEITEQFSERVLQRTAAPEASAMHGMRHARERIGRVVVTAEASRETAVRESGREQPAGQAKQEAPVISKHVEEMNRGELMAISEKIIVDGSSLRKIYENRLIGERGLRRLVAEHLRGGDLKRALRREIVEREIDFERDPVMRDHPSAIGGTGGGSGSHVPLEMLLQKAAASLPSNAEEAAYYTARAEYEAKRQAGKSRQQRLLDTSMTGVIIVLLVTIVILIIQRG